MNAAEKINKSIFRTRRNKLLFLCLLLSSRLIFAENNLRSLFDFKEYPSKEIAITDRGTFESQYIKDTDYSVC